VSEIHDEFAISTLELLYQCNDFFCLEVAKLRKAYDIKINDDGIFEIDDLMELDSRFIKNNPLQKKFQSDVFVLCEKFDLVESQEETQMFVESGLSYNDASLRANLSKPPATKIRDKAIYGTSDNVPGMGVIVELFITRPISAKGLENWLDQNKERILLACNENFRGIKAAVTRNKQLPRILEIVKLRESGKSFKEVTDTVCDMFQDDPDVIDGKVNEQSVKMTYYRYTKRKK